MEISNDQYLTAIDESIKHWQENKKNLSMAKIYGSNCTLCQLVGDICEACPLYFIDEECYPENIIFPSTWENAVEAYRNEDMKNWHAACDSMIAVLEKSREAISCR